MAGKGQKKNVRNPSDDAALLSVALPPCRILNRSIKSVTCGTPLHIDPRQLEKPPLHSSSTEIDPAEQTPAPLQTVPPSGGAAQVEYSKNERKKMTSSHNTNSSHSFIAFYSQRRWLILCCYNTGWHVSAVLIGQWLLWWAGRSVEMKHVSLIGLNYEDDVAVLSKINNKVMHNVLTMYFKLKKKKDKRF